jgi:hypothetical protein
MTLKKTASSLHQKLKQKLLKETKMGAIRAHSTATDDESSWDAAAATSAVNPTAPNLKAMHAHQDPEGDPEAKSTYSFPHHNVNADGSVGAANTSAASAGIAALNGGRGGHSMSTEDKVGVHAHLSKHLEDAGKEAPPLKGAGAGEANASITTIAADAEPVLGPVDAEDNSFNMPVMVVEGRWTGDARYVVPGALTWRNLPLPAMALKTTTMDHTGAELVGKIDTIDRSDGGDDGTNVLIGNGQFDTAANAAEIKRLIGGGYLRGVSVDIGDAMSEFVWLDSNGEECPESDDDDDWDLFDLLFGFSAATEPQPGEPYMMGEKIFKGKIMGATICPFPAFEGAFVQIGDVAMAASGEQPPFDDQLKMWMPSINIVDRQGERKMNGLTAGAAPMVPPANWFHNPNLNAPTAITVEQSGEIFGHLALWTECHMSYQSQCIKAPHSMADYAYMHTGVVLCENDELVPTGVITINTGHAELWQNPSDAKAHYDNTGAVIADAAFGEDSLGIWFHGSLRPDADDLSVRRLRGAALSGDWRMIGGNLELVAALAVNVPGFPVKRPAARVAAGAPLALVAAGRLTQKDAIRWQNRSVPVQASTAEMSSRDMDVLVGYVRRDLRAQVHKDGR